MSRTLDRLRSELGDELLVRIGRSYELTLRAAAIMSELGQMMPRLARLWEGEPFSPAQSEAKVRVAMTDDASSIVLPPLSEIIGRLAPGITLEVVPWHDQTHEDHLAAQLMLSPIAAPSTFRFEPLFEDSFVCVVRRKLKRSKGAIAMKESLSFRHISIETQPNQQNLIDRSLAEAGLRRHIAVHLPYFQAAIRVLEATDLVLTMPTWAAEPTLAALDFCRLKAPKEIPPYGT